ncbi:DUF1553 domain-containing protein [Pleomorphovibrio marinus]|uniref:DUF1553 domain-containing protein n=1 Tax=Pleomorphovibrio marinus TaxID=2164132 RepID=UPI001E47365B|nr:DUF1553 domain-containing protein [Pleomorphovibrio marinus]
MLLGCERPLPEEVEVAMEDLPEKLDYNLHIKPILSDKCFACHGPDKAARKAGLRLDMADAAFSTLPDNPGKVAIKPGNIRKSELISRILSDDPDYKMPSPESHLVLTPKEKAMLVSWVKEGAEYKKHWAFIPLEKVVAPSMEQQDWMENEIDLFIGNTLKEQGLTPNARADKATLLRRLSFDLTGLPPTLEELDQFLADESEDAYEKQVDRLLASPHYGEKMAMHWMDVARYADTHGYTVDRFRDMSPYRDWVIKAFNENLSYDKFVLYQLAGDLLPNPTKEQKLATAFNRIHPQNMEGGIVEEEFRVEYVADRTNTIGKAFMALTLECARCHDHKYDPITQKEYFELSSFFNQVDEAGQISWDNAMPVPTMLWADEEKEQLLEMLKKDVEKEEASLVQEKTAAEERFQNWLAQEKYQELKRNIIGLVGYFDFEKKPVRNLLEQGQKVTMESNEVKKEAPQLVEGYRGKGALLDGDAWLDMGGVGVFGKSEPFSVSLWVNLPKELKNGAIFHTGTGAVLYNRRGYHLYLKDNKLELVLAHTAPYNAIIKETLEDVPRERWINLTLTYDGSGKADGLNVYLEGKVQAAETKKDNLYKDILFVGPSQPGLQIGAVWRGRGLKGAQVDECKVFDRQLTSLEITSLVSPESFEKFIDRPKSSLTEEEQHELRNYFLHVLDVSYRQALDQLKQVRKKQAKEVEPVQEVMVMEDMPQSRPTFLLERGEYHAHGDEVFANTPTSVLALSDDLPKNRLGLALWLTDPQHPLTARVAVNRFWLYLFGRGLVSSAGDFGNQGELPSHPELLDWLAFRFMESGWDIKSLHKEIVMSGSYRRSSHATENQREMDPDNTWLARGPSGRLPGEMMRDNALFASGLLNLKIGGPSVRPYQPEGLWRVNGAHYEEDKGENLYRRSLYTIWKRSVPNPSLHIFDAPERSESVAVRQKTNTPLQALVLLNDPTYVEAAKVLGHWMAEQDNVEDGIVKAFRKLSARPPNPKELEVLLSLQKKEKEKFETDPGRSLGWLASGEYDLANIPNQAAVAAAAVVASTIMNSDAVITKR